MGATLREIATAKIDQQLQHRKYLSISGKIKIGTGRPEWGAEPGKEYFVLCIKKKILFPDI